MRAPSNSQVHLLHADARDDAFKLSGAGVVQGSAQNGKVVISKNIYPSGFHEEAFPSCSASIRILSGLNTKAFNNYHTSHTTPQLWLSSGKRPASRTLITCSFRRIADCTRSYNRYLAVAARVVRRSLKEGPRLQAERRGEMDLRFAKWTVRCQQQE
jgi:hypothetical protein